MERRTFLQSASILALPALGRRLAPLRLFAQAGAGPAIQPDLLTKTWSGKWIAVPGASPSDYGVYHFRRVFDLTAKPSVFIVHVMR
jgi:hypothetical protein